MNDKPEQSKQLQDAIEQLRKLPPAVARRIVELEKARRAKMQKEQIWLNGSIPLDPTASTQPPPCTGQDTVPYRADTPQE